MSCPACSTVQARSCRFEAPLLTAVLRGSVEPSPPLIGSLWRLNRAKICGRASANIAARKKRGKCETRRKPGARAQAQQAPAGCIPLQLHGALGRLPSQAVVCGLGPRLSGRPDRADKWLCQGAAALRAACWQGPVVLVAWFCCPRRSRWLTRRGQWPQTLQLRPSD